MYFVKKKGNKLLTFCWLICCCFVPFPCIFLNEVQIYWQPSFFDSGDTHTPPVSLRVSDQTHPGPHILQLLEKFTRPTKITPTRGITAFQLILSSRGSCRPSEGSPRPHAIFFCYTRLNKMIYISSVGAVSLHCQVTDLRPISYLEHWK